MFLSHEYSLCFCRSHYNLFMNKSKFWNKKTKYIKSAFPKLHSDLYATPILRSLMEANLRHSELWSVKFLAHPLRHSLSTQSHARFGAPALAPAVLQHIWDGTGKRVTSQAHHLHFSSVPPVSPQIFLKNTIFMLWVVYLMTSMKKSSSLNSYFWLITFNET